MEKPLAELYKVLQTLIGLHRQLMETVRSERELLVEADVRAIQACTDTKQGLVESIYWHESNRLKVTGELAILWKRPYRELTLPNIAIAIQEKDPKGAENFRSANNMLTILIQRISEQNHSNLALIESSLNHIHQMKKNILVESNAKSSTYTQNGQRMASQNTSRIISKEA